MIYASGVNTIEEILQDLIKTRDKCRREIILKPLLNIKFVIGDLERAIKKLTIIRTSLQMEQNERNN